MEPPGPYLFVYGTLRRAAGHLMADYLAARTRWLGRARCPGRLYHLGPYPGMVAAGGAGEWVHGEVYELTDPEEVLAVLDRYEGCAPEAKPPGPFARGTAGVELPSGENRTCWVYFFTGPEPTEGRIFSGDYADLLGVHG